ncbi:MAG TPA: 50S ribosomal protein L5, partial [Bacteroidales bacterium]|nr:50S ribosomal protein L5 [Bacteroidales bacterium]
MDYTPNLKTKYDEEIVPALTKKFSYGTIMEVPRLVKVVINAGVGDAVADKKLIDVAQEELSNIAGQKAIQTVSTKDVSNFKLRKGMPIGVKVTLRRTKMYEFM